jgi:hypothetical protein
MHSTLLLLLLLLPLLHLCCIAEALLSPQALGAQHAIRKDAAQA